MESHISHGLAAHFTQIPKAYSVSSLKRRVNQRELFLTAYDYDNKDEITIGNVEGIRKYEYDIMNDNYTYYLSNSIDSVYTYINKNIGNKKTVATTLE